MISAKINLKKSGKKYMFYYSIPIRLITEDKHIIKCSSDSLIIFNILSNSIELLLYIKQTLKLF